jgi:hypothetical protein
MKKLVWRIKVELLHFIGLHELTIRELSHDDRIKGYSEACCPKSGL